jgi:hypothetical protein
MRENKCKLQTPAGKVMDGVCWDSEGVFLGKFLKRGAIVNSDLYVRTLKKLKRRIRSFQPNRKTYQALILPTVPIKQTPTSIFLGP